jgi:predicted nucleotidyltransferase component of viral defense system
MITKDEIDHKAEEFDVHVANVQRDYVFGWLLKAISEDPYLSGVLILKGGNGFRKAYFENARFSDDLDFSTEVALDILQLQQSLLHCCEYIQTATQVEFDTDRNTFKEEGAIDIGSEARQKIYRARIFFADFYGEKSSFTIAIRLDISEFDKIYLPTKSARLIHPYSDSNACVAVIRCLSLEEMIANKMKCLLQRRHSHDLFDMVYAYLWKSQKELNRLDILSVFLRKTIFQPSPIAAKNLLLGLPFDFFKLAWQRYVVCPVESRFNFELASENFRAFIEELFAGHSDRPSTTLAFFPAHLRNPIMDAAREQKMLRVTYDGVSRLVEPYALAYKRRKDMVAQEYFYCWDTTGGRTSGAGVKTLLNLKISEIEITDQKFEPRYEVELSKAGEIPKATYFAGHSRSGFFGGGLRPRRTSRPSAFARIYLVQCPYCQKQFKRKTHSLVLKPHKSPDGYQCNSRHGYLVR